MPDDKMIAPGFFGGLLVGIVGTILTRPSIARRLRYVPPLGAINFNQGNLGGWSIDGIYDGDSTNKVSQAPGLVWLDESDVSSLPKLDPVSDNKGSIGFAMGPNLPNTNDAPSGLWRVDLVSPDLSGDPQWVGANGVVAAFADTSTQFPVATPRIRFGFQVRKSDGSLYLLEEVNSAGAPVQHLLLTSSGKFQGHQEWYHLGANLPVTIGETIAGIRIKVYGAAVQPGSFLVYAPGYLALDNLIPIQ